MSAEESRRPSSARAALTMLTTPARSATTQEQPGSLAVGGGAVGTLVFIEGALLKSNMSSSVAAYWSRAVRCGRVPPPSARLRKRFSMRASSEVYACAAAGCSPSVAEAAPSGSTADPSGARNLASVGRRRGVGPGNRRPCRRRAHGRLRPGEVCSLLRLYCLLPTRRVTERIRWARVLHG